MSRTTARAINENQIIAYDEWDKLPTRLQGMGTRVALIGPDGWLFELAGPGCGRQGVRMARSLQGEHHWPFDVLVTEGAYQMGLTIERTNYKGREINAGITVGGQTPQQLSEFQYRMAEDLFFDQLNQDRFSWLCVYTRFSGWRFTQVRLRGTVDTAQPMDTTAFGNNTATWDIVLIAPKPYYSKRMVWDTWDAVESHKNRNEVQFIALSGSPGGSYTVAFNGSPASAAIAINATAETVETRLESLSTIGVGNIAVTGNFNDGYTCEFIGTMAGRDFPSIVVDDSGVTGGDVVVTTIIHGTKQGDPNTATITLKNAGDLPAYPMGIIVGAGQVSIQDGLTDFEVDFEIFPEDGSFVMLNTDPEEVTLVSAKDPIDNFFYQRIRASRILEAVLHNISERGERIDLRLDKRFHSAVPPYTVANLRVRHSNPSAKITLFMPQRFKRSR